MDYLPTLPLTLTPLMAFGLILVIGALGGFLAHRIPWLPSITGFMLVGFAFGPSGLALLDQQVMAGSKVFVDVALAMILYRLGLSLDLKSLTSSPRLLVTSLLESTLTFLCVIAVLVPMDIPGPVAALVAAVVISSSPSVLLHVAHEVGARGPVTEETKSLVALNNLLAFLVFSLTLSSVHHAAGAGLTTMILQPVYQLSGSFLLGIAMGHGLHQVATRTAAAQQYRLALVIGTLVLALTLAQGLRVSGLFTALVIGVLIRTVERDDPLSSLEFGQPFELFFILLFVYAGASLHLQELFTFLPAVLALVVARSCAKLAGPLLVGRVLHIAPRASQATGLLLLPMAGLAIGLTFTSSRLFPAYGATISALVLGAVTVFEAIGPPIAAFAFRHAGEAAAAADTSSPPPAVPGDDT